jgi:hypothetical protein
MIVRRPMLHQLATVGWKEHVRFPKLKLGPVVAKIDTGARSAALHADHIDIEGQWVRFRVEGKRCAAPLKGFKRVKSSNGQSEMRPVIRATIELGTAVIKAEITLTDRSDMGVPMLLGRSTIKGKFLVNPGKTFLLSRKRKVAE